MDEDFKRELFCLVPTLLAPENLVVKEIGGARLTCRDLLLYFKVTLTCRDLLLYCNPHL